MVPRFQHVLGTIQSLEPHGSGLINDTYKLSVLPPHENDDVVCYILQRINHQVFTQPVQVMANIERVTKHLAEKIRQRSGNVQRETLTLIPTTGESSSRDEDAPLRYFVVDDRGNYWRMYNYISGATAYPIGASRSVLIPTARDGNRQINPYREAGAAVGQFQLDLADLPPAPRLHETIPGFGDSAVRFDQFQVAVSSDLQGRAKDCQPEIQFCLEREAESQVLPRLLRDGNIPERIAHYDTKIDNILIDDATGKGLCVIDLDTVMPGLAIYDFGDCVRTATALAEEDELDLTKFGFSMEVFEWVADGYLSIAKSFLTELEMDHLVQVARMVTFTMGLRFLADHLNGDVHYKTTRDNHNLDRARTQLKMVAEMESHEEEMHAIVQRLRV